MAFFEKSVDSIQIDVRYIPYLEQKYPESAAPEKDGMKTICFDSPIKKSVAENIVAKAKAGCEKEQDKIERLKQETGSIFISYSQGAEAVIEEARKAGIEINKTERQAGGIKLMLNRYNFDKLQPIKERVAMNPRKVSPEVPKPSEPEKIQDELLDLIQEAEPEELPPAKDWRTKEKQRKRSHQVMTRLTDEELAIFNERVQSTGQRQADYIRSAILTGSINQLPANNAELMTIHQDFLDMRADLGRIGGLLKAAIKPNEQNPLCAEEVVIIKKQLRQLADLQKKLDKEAGKIWQS